MQAHWGIVHPNEKRLMEFPTYHDIFHAADRISQGSKGTRCVMCIIKKIIIINSNYDFFCVFASTSRMPGVDPQQSGLDDAFTPEQYDKMCTHLMERIAKDSDPKAAIMTMMTLSILFSASSRGDESLLLRFCDFGRPVVQPSVGPCQAELHKLVVFMAKTNAGKKPDIMPLIPHVNIDNCPVFAICYSTHLGLWPKDAQCNV